MVSVEGVGPPGTPRPIGRGKVAGAGFVLPQETTATGSAPAAAAAAPAALATMLALQELGGEAAADREARHHGERLLVALGDLQRALLGGESDDALRRLAELMDTMPPAADMRLAAAISAITLRARIELARRQR